MLFIRADGVFAGQHLGFQLPHAAVQPQHRGLPDGYVQIAGPLVDDRLQQLVDQDRTHDVLLAGLAGQAAADRNTLNPSSTVGSPHTEMANAGLLRTDREHGL